MRCPKRKKNKKTYIGWNTLATLVRRKAWYNGCFDWMNNASHPKAPKNCHWQKNFCNAAWMSIGGGSRAGEWYDWKKNNFCRYIIWNVKSALLEVMHYRVLLFRIWSSPLNSINWPQWTAQTHNPSHVGAFECDFLSFWDLPGFPVSMFTHLPAIGSRFTPLLDYSGAEFDLGAGSQFINIGCCQTYRIRHAPNESSSLLPFVCLYLFLSFAELRYVHWREQNHVTLWGRRRNEYPPRSSDQITAERWVHMKATPRKAIHFGKFHRLKPRRLHIDRLLGGNCRL